jgi:hypothetical protein
VQISLAKVAAAADEAVSEPKPVDVGHIINDMSVLVGIGREVIVLLKCILVLLFFSASWDSLHSNEASLN